VKKVVIDVESTGLTIGHSEIIALSALVFDDVFEIEKRFFSYIKPIREPDPKAMRINQIKITDDMPSSMTVKSQFIEWLEMDKYFVHGYNAKLFDIQLLKIWLPDYDRYFHYKAFDVDQLVYQACGESLTLTEACKKYNVIHKPHDANGDAWATLKLMEILL
jgi:DNA polymerase III alpha subunit (gram-positive type)